jgi:hypothetical protein
VPHQNDVATTKKYEIKQGEQGRVEILLAK